MRSAGAPTGSSRSSFPLIVLKSSNDATALTAATSASARCSPHFPSRIAQLRFYRRPNQTKPRILTDEHGLRAGSLSLIRVYPCDPWSVFGLTPASTLARPPAHPPQTPPHKTFPTLPPRSSPR